MSEQQPRLSRRHVVRAGAWSVPAVSVAVAAPAFAASPPGALIFNTYQANGSD